MTPPGMLGDEGHRALDEQEANLFPATVRPRFLRLLWLALGILGVAAAVLLAALGEKLR